MLSPATSIDRSLAALAHPVRRAIVDRLRDGELTVGEISAPYAMKKPTFSRHLKILEHAGLVARRVRGRQHYCRLRGERLQELRTWLERYERFWTAQLDSLDDHLARRASRDPE
jgi:DNA-binding transcriptional ArsR family regulator